MPTRATNVPHAKARHNPEQDEWRAKAPTSALVEHRVRERFEAIVAFVGRSPPAGRTYREFEAGLVALVFSLGRLLVTLFLCRRHEELEVPEHEVVDGERHARSQAQDRDLATFFGKVHYWRTYMRGKNGHYPLDRALRLPTDGFSLGVAGLIVKLATKMSYEQARLLQRCFLLWAPAKATIARLVLGLGTRTGAWFAQAPPPEDDGDTLVIMIDSKATPTATKSELAKRRKKRGKRGRGNQGSSRQRRRGRRAGWEKKPRRKKGDHSKNGRATTLVVMYTLRNATDDDGQPCLDGPFNRRIYASYSPKRHAFAVARRDANKRGFGPGSGKRIQIVIDGDKALELYARELFPEARITLDVIHATEYLWKAGRSFYPEGSKALEKWATAQKERLREGKIREILRDLEQALERIPKTGPGNKGKRDRLKSALGYLSARVDLMNYHELMDLDLETSTGAVEGAVRYVVGQRLDTAGMRWIPERAEALLQLRCIEINGHWDDFIRFVEQSAPPDFELTASKPAPLPSLGLEGKRAKKVA